MDRQPVGSSSLVSVGYDGKSHMLEVQFRNGRIYRYFKVPPADYTRLMTASSLGRYFNAYIRNRYEYRQVSRRQTHFSHQRETQVP